MIPLFSLDLGAMAAWLLSGRLAANPRSPAGSVYLAMLAFAVAVFIALVATPWVERRARGWGLVDLPSFRKVHRRPIPRVGGIAIALASIVPFAAGAYCLTRWPGTGLEHRQAFALLLGCGIAFGLGLWDDLRGVRPGLKLVFQAAAGLVAFAGGIRIEGILLPGLSFQLGFLSLPVTVFWFLLVMNAINLIDGLDGLAAGVCFFSAIVLAVLALIGHKVLVAFGLATLAGATLGFLRYNFNPAIIFMGDCGSYFLGFALGALSIWGSMQSEASVTILIPIVILGLPLMDTIWSTIRRFLKGRGLFNADGDHLHHRLLRKGYTHRRAVLVLYGMTVGLGAISLLMVHADDREAAAILTAIALVMGIFIRRLGYLDYLTSEKLLGWANDLMDMLRMEKGHRTFLGLQAEIAEARTIDEAWIHIVEAARHLRMDFVSLELRAGTSGEPLRMHAGLGDSGDGRAPWLGGLDRETTLRIAFPVGCGEAPVGYFSLAKDMRTAPVEYHTLRRVEHLRRTLCETVPKVIGHRSPAVLVSPRTHAAPLPMRPPMVRSGTPATESRTTGVLRVRESGTEDAIPVPAIPGHAAATLAREEGRR